MKRAAATRPSWPGHPLRLNAPPFGLRRAARDQANDEEEKLKPKRGHFYCGRGHF
jgi:hypothetical protein